MGEPAKQLTVESLRAEAQSLLGTASKQELKAVNLEQVITTLGRHFQTDLTGYLGDIIDIVDELLLSRSDLPPRPEPDVDSLSDSATSSDWSEWAVEEVRVKIPVQPRVKSEKEKKIRTPKIDDVTKQKIPKVKVAKVDDSPNMASKMKKLGVTPYGCFVKAQRSVTVAGDRPISKQDFIKLQRDKWRDLQALERQPFIEEAARINAQLVVAAVKASSNNADGSASSSSLPLPSSSVLPLSSSSMPLSSSPPSSPSLFGPIRDNTSSCLSTSMGVIGAGDDPFLHLDGFAGDADDPDGGDGMDGAKRAKISSPHADSTGVAKRQRAPRPPATVTAYACFAEEHRRTQRRPTNQEDDTDADGQTAHSDSKGNQNLRDLWKEMPAEEKAKYQYVASAKNALRVEKRRLREQQGKFLMQGIEPGVASSSTSSSGPSSLGSSMVVNHHLGLSQPNHQQSEGLNDSLLLSDKSHHVSADQSTDQDNCRMGLNMFGTETTSDSHLSWNLFGETVV